MQHFTTDGHYSSSYMLFVFLTQTVVTRFGQYFSINLPHHTCFFPVLSSLQTMKVIITMFFMMIMMMTNVTTALHGRFFFSVFTSSLFIFIFMLQKKNQFFSFPFFNSFFLALYFTLSFSLSPCFLFNECVAFARRNKIIINNIMRDLLFHLSQIHFILCIPWFFLDEL